MHGNENEKQLLKANTDAGANVPLDRLVSLAAEWGNKYREENGKAHAAGEAKDYSTALMCATRSQLYLDCAKELQEALQG
jgi:hypothetical protein